MTVLSGLLPGADGMVEKHGINRASVQPKVVGSPDGIIGIIDRDAVGGIVLPIEETGDAQDAVAIGAGGVAAEGNGEQLERLFLPRKVEPFDAPKYLILTGRRGENRGRWRHQFRCPERSETGIPVCIYIEV